MNRPMIWLVWVEYHSNGIIRLPIPTLIPLPGYPAIT
jgi:hypothetical protein